MTTTIYKSNTVFHQLDLSALKYFYVIASFGGFSRAARAIGASQPSLSLGLQKLEKILGAKLIERSSRHFALTSEGLVLLRFCQKLEGQLEAVVTDLGQDRVSVRKRLKIGAALSIGFSPLSFGILAQAQAKAPMELELTLQKTPVLVSELIAGNLDAALVPDDVIDAALNITRLKHDEVVFVVNGSVNAALKAQFSKVSWRKAALGLPLITFPRETPMRSLIDRFCLQNDIRFKTQFSIDSMDAMIGLVARGAGGAFLIRSIIKENLKNKELFEVDVPFALPRTGIAIATRADDQGRAIANLVKGLIRI